MDLEYIYLFANEKKEKEKRREENKSKLKNPSLSFKLVKLVSLKYYS